MGRAVSMEQWGKKPDCGRFKRECEERNMEIAMCRLLFQEAKDSQFFQLFHGTWFPVWSSLLVVHSQMRTYFCGSLATGHSHQRDFINTGSRRSINPPVLEILFLLMKPKTTFALWGTVLYASQIHWKWRGEGLPRVWESKTTQVEVPARSTSVLVRYLYKLNILETVGSLKTEIVPYLSVHCLQGFTWSWI